MGLSMYRTKRNFAKTSEPLPMLRRSVKLPIFVVQKHRASQLHYDFRLELGGALKSWAVPKGPPRRAKDKKLAVMVEDHPYAYKDFHGKIPKGEYGAGTVEIWDKGTYEQVGSLESGLRKGHAAFILHGKKLHGEYALIKFRGPKNWLLIKARAIKNKK